MMVQDLHLTALISTDFVAEYCVYTVFLIVVYTG